MAPDNEARAHNVTEKRYRAEDPGTWLRLSCCQGSVHPVHILDRADGYVTISAPTEPHPSWVKRPLSTETITLGYSDAGGTILLNCLPVAESINDDSWSLRVVGTGDFLQRRRHVRVGSDATVRLMGASEFAGVSGRVLDISESGMRCMFEEFIPQAHNNPFMWALDLGDYSLAVTSVMRWAGRIGPLEYQAGFEFVDGASLAIELRSYIMSQLDKAHLLA